MTTLLQDPKGYYAALGLAPGATLGAIKTAYRNRVKAVHPDRNRRDGAAEEFQRLVEAYTILKDVVRRAEYDAVTALGVAEDDPAAPAIPLCCGSCGKVTAQPRYVIFHRVKSFLVWAKTRRDEGIFCRDCADHAAVKASTSTWAWGWWSPTGLILTPLALLSNLLGGSMPRRDNTRLLLRQARAFLERGDDSIARSLADQAGKFAREPAHRKQIEDYRLRTQGVNRRLKNRWSLGGGAFLAQLAPLVALPVVLAIFAVIWSKPWNEPVTAGVAGIMVAPATIGEIRHVAVGELKVRQEPAENAPVLTLLDRFATITVEAAPGDRQWTQVRTPSGVSGWVPSRALYVGNGKTIKSEWCAENRGATPDSAEVLVRRATGDHRMLIHNDGRHDAVVKLKTHSGSTVVSYFVPATYHVGVNGIPEGTYLIEFATGDKWSRGCGLFVDGMQTARLPFTLTFKPLSTVRAASLGSMPEIALVTAPNDTKAPQPIPMDRFLADE